ncbi:MAG: GNVR domain-containing protein [Candidatus Binatia bacterium]
MDMFANGFSIEKLLDLLRRRLWIALVLFSICLSLMASFAFFLPNVYHSQALVLIEGQQIPREYVKSPVTKVVERRLQEISQELLSRSRLEQLSEQFGLYSKLKKEGASSETIAKAMRKDISIKVISGRGSDRGEAAAFRVGYTSPDPQKAMQVANQLASLYIDANMRRREREALSTSDFLAKQVEDVKKRLEEQEHVVTEYKRAHMGELPEQRDANLRMIDALQKQMVLLSENIARAQERRNMAVQMAEMDAALAEVESLKIETTGNTAPADQQLAMLRGELARLKIRFSDKHPDVIRIKQLIATLEEQEAAQMSASMLSPETLSPAVENFVKPSTAHIEIAAIDNEIRRLTSEMQKAGNDIAMYQQRIENTPRIEQELLSITRDYETSRDLYETLLKRLDEAQLADKLERNQKAEKFRLLEAAYFPDKPAAPQRPYLLFLALFVSLGVAGGGVVLREMLDTSFHEVDDLKRFVKVPVLVTIPRIVTTADLWQKRFRQGLGAAALAVSLIVLVGAAYRFASGNEGVTRLLLGTSGGNQLLTD